MKFALNNGAKLEATKGAKGICPICSSELIAKCGNLKVNHWAHKGKHNCDLWWENETEWHRNWKNKFPIDWQEVIHFDTNGEKHIADVKTNNNWIIEFQHSFLKPEERLARKAFYKKLIWVVDGKRRDTDYKQFSKAFNDGLIMNKKHKYIRRLYIDECRLLRDWSGFSPVFIDFGGETLWWLFEKGKNEQVYVAPFSISEFLNIHLIGLEQKVDEFNKFTNDIRGLIAQYESQFRGTNS